MNGFYFHMLVTFKNIKKSVVWRLSFSCKDWDQIVIFSFPVFWVKVEILIKSAPAPAAAWVNRDAIVAAAHRSPVHIPQVEGKQGRLHRCVRKRLCHLQAIRLQWHWVDVAHGHTEKIKFLSYRWVEPEVRLKSKGHKGQTLRSGQDPEEYACVWGGWGGRWGRVRWASMNWFNLSLTRTCWLKKMILHLKIYK